MLLRNQLNLFWSSHYIPTKEEEQDLVVAELSEACPLGASFSDALQFLHFWQPLQHWEHLPAGMASIYWASELSARKMLELRPARSPKNCSSATRIWKKTNKQPKQWILVEKAAVWNHLGTLTLVKTKQAVCGIFGNLKESHSDWENKRLMSPTVFTKLELAPVICV